MWLLFAILLFIIAFIFVKKAEQKQNKHSNEPSQEQDMQTHSVVTDAVHEEPPHLENQPLDPPDTKITQSEEQQTQLKTVTIETEKEEELSDFLTDYNRLKEQFEMAQKWYLFNTEAAFFWHKDNPIITILCLSSFHKGEANKLNYKDYHFNIESWSWHGASPKGAATEIKKHLTSDFKNHY